eukprot:CAMPEP_0202062876 /NCGR_PEP_ID=MMETSP0963-20130614/45004_1 /ASSEMBLY_ACC=CAM_ASM_000494 /TAXON_ID=4773 /ORGANISM="Schizochytrium aggregatum, Strain ATCC28209" /LENGTH=64 /DNA_ID=CAMNT_0048629225 /DNA_START=12 /DNA_END=202 /DNA_ORIENTATION=+
MEVDDYELEEANQYETDVDVEDKGVVPRLDENDRLRQEYEARHRVLDARLRALRANEQCASALG